MNPAILGPLLLCVSAAAAEELWFERWNGATCEKGTLAAGTVPEGAPTFATREVCCATNYDYAYEECLVAEPVKVLNGLEITTVLENDDRLFESAWGNIRDHCKVEGCTENVNRAVGISGGKNCRLAFTKFDVDCEAGDVFQVYDTAGGATSYCTMPSEDVALTGTGFHLTFISGRSRTDDVFSLSYECSNDREAVEEVPRYAVEMAFGQAREGATCDDVKMDLINNRMLQAFIDLTPGWSVEVVSCCIGNACKDLRQGSTLETNNELRLGFEITTNGADSSTEDVGAEFVTLVQEDFASDASMIKSRDVASQVFDEVDGVERVITLIVTPAPATGVPNTLAPESSPDATTVPGSFAPSTGVPNTLAPESAPDATTAPVDTTTPSTSTPVDATVPSTSTPVDATTPSTSTPVDATVPSPPAPVDTTTPSTSTPVDATTPSQPTREIDVSGDDGLSGGAVAGIVAGGVILIVGGVVAAVVCRSRASEGATELQSPPASDYDMSPAAAASPTEPLA